jgi:hypothetical protein
MGQDGFTSPPSPEGRRAEDFYFLKNPTASAGFEIANLGTKGQHATSRPTKTLIYVLPNIRAAFFRYSEMSRNKIYVYVIVSAFSYLSLTNLILETK